MKRITIIVFVLFTHFINAQYFRIFPDFYDSLPNGQYRFHIEGLAEFNDSMVVEVQLVSPDSLQTVFYSGAKDFSNPSASTISNFTYNQNTKQFSIPNIGLFPTKDMHLWIRSRINGEIREEILIIKFD